MPDETAAPAPVVAASAEPVKVDPAPAPATEPPAAPAAPVTEKKDDSFAKQFALLSKKERDIYQKEQRLKHLDKVDAELKADAELKKTNRLAWLKKHEVTYDQLTDDVLSTGKGATTDELRDLRNEVQSIRAERQAEKEAAERMSQEAQLGQFQKGLSDFVTSNEKYEFIRSRNAVPIVYATIEEYLKESSKNGEAKLLSYAEAADMVEEHLETQFKKEIESNKKAKAFLDALKATASEPVGGQPPTNIPPKTLTNKIETTVPNRAANKPKTREESIRESAKLIRWNTN